MELSSTTVDSRAIELLSHYPKVSGTWEKWKALGEKYGIDPILAIAIARADSQLGNYLTTANNIGNVGNNDRGDRVHFGTIDEGIEAIFRTLNNRYLGPHTRVGELSGGGRHILGLFPCSTRGTYCYASSIENWNINVLNTMSLIYNTNVDEHFIFRK